MTAHRGLAFGIFVGFIACSALVPNAVEAEGLRPATPVSHPVEPAPPVSTATGFGLALVSVDAAACVPMPPACEGDPPEPSSGTNANPVRVVVQVATPSPLNGLTAEAFAVATPFAPPGAAPVRLAPCASCFEAAPGGTYSLWLAPESGSWTPGTYFLRIGLAGSGAVLPALARIDIPMQIFPPQGEPPRASLVASPAGEQQTGRIAIFDASGSFDPDGPITFWRWTIVSDATGVAPEIVQGPTDRTLERIYDVEQGLAVQLEVTDDPTAPALAAAGQPVPWDDTRVISYRITCSNPPPIVDAGPDQTQNAVTSGQTVTVALDGTGTLDDKSIASTADHYHWDCGNGTVAVPFIPGDYRKVVCRYTAIRGLPNTWTATLTVLDNGSTGELENGIYPCQRSASDSAIVRLVMP